MKVSLCTSSRLGFVCVRQCLIAWNLLMKERRRAFGGGAVLPGYLDIVGILCDFFYFWGREQSLNSWHQFLNFSSWTAVFRRFRLNKIYRNIYIDCTTDAVLKFKLGEWRTISSLFFVDPILPCRGQRHLPVAQQTTTILKKKKKRS